MLLLLTFSMASQKIKSVHILYSTIFAYITVFVFLSIPKSIGMICGGNGIPTTIWGLF